MIDFNPADDARAFRTALGAYATGITIVTAPSPDGPVGITANSFASVSLDPPLVLWSPAKSSNRFAYFSGAPHCAIHVLDAHQQAISDGFGKNKAAFDDLDWEIGPNDVPLLRGCLARFECSLQAEHDAGDHSILIGRVHRASARDGLPLLFQGGRFMSPKG